VLSNANLLEEAEHAFADAEPISADWDHFHQARGINLVWLGRFEEAEKCLRRAIELQPNGALAKGHLARVLMKLGRTREAERLAHEVEHRSARRPLEEWETRLQRRPNATSQWTRTAYGWAIKQQL
jgi:Flp pilus assembly protein TadD